MAMTLGRADLINRNAARLEWMQHQSHQQLMRVTTIDDGLNQLIAISIDVFKILSDAFAPYIQPPTPLDHVIRQAIHEQIQRKWIELRDIYREGYETLLDARDRVMIDGVLVLITDENKDELRDNYLVRVSGKVNEIFRPYLQRLDSLADAGSTLVDMNAELQRDIAVKEQVMHRVFEGRTDLTMRYIDSLNNPELARLRQERQALRETPHEGFFHFCVTGDVEGARQHIQAQGFGMRNNLLGGKTALLNQKDAEGYAPLHLASMHGHDAFVQYLIERKADVHCVSSAEYEEFTPLHFAAKGGFVSVAERLIAAGAAVNTKGSFGRNPLHTAAYQGHDQMVDLLLSHGANINEKQDETGQTPRRFAVNQNEIEVVLKLLNTQGLQLDVEDDRFETPLVLAVRQGWTDCILLIMGHPSWKPCQDTTKPYHLDRLLEIPGISDEIRGILTAMRQAR